MIPKIIHCCWFGGPKTELAKKCRASWERFAPDWEIREFVLSRDHPPFVTDALAAKKWAVASDWARMKALYDEGGVYLDYDVELVRPIDGLPEGEWVSGEWTAMGGVWMNPGGGIALEKGSSVARGMLERYERLDFDPKRVMMEWINESLGAAAGEKGLTVLPPEIMSPIGVDGRLRRTEKTVAIHWYAMSWASPKQKVLQWLSWHGFRWAIDWALKVKRFVAGRRSPRRAGGSL